MMKSLIFVLSITLVQICQATESALDDLSVIPRSPPTTSDFNEETHDVLLNNQQNTVQAKFKIRLNFKPYNFKSHNHSVLKIKYDFNELHQLLRLDQFVIEQNDSQSASDSSLIPTLTSPCLNTSTLFHKSCFRLEERRIQLKERQSTMTKWRKNLKAFASKLAKQKTDLDQQEQSLNEDAGELRVRRIKLESSQLEFDEENRTLWREKSHLQSKWNQLTAYEREFKEKINNLVDLLDVISNETLTLYTNCSKLNDNVDQHNVTHCNVQVEALEHQDVYSELCQWNESLGRKMHELKKAKEEFEEYTTAGLDGRHHQPDGVEELQHVWNTSLFYEN